MTARAIVLAVAGALAAAAHAAGPAIGPAPAAPSCGAPPRLSAESLLAAGRFWHAWRVLPPLRSRTRPVPADSVVLYGRAAEGLGRFAQVDSLLRRARGGDTLAAFQLLAARADERAGRWRAAELRYRRALGLAADQEAARVASVRLAMMLELEGRRDSATLAWRRAALAVPDLADWLALRRAALEPDTAVAFAAVSSPRTPGAFRGAQLFIAQRRFLAGDLPGALDLFARYGRPLDVARVEFAMGRRRQARERSDSVLLRDPGSVVNPNPFLAGLFLAERFDSLSFDEDLAVSRAYRARGDRLAAARFARAALARATGRSADSLAMLAWLELARIEAERREFGAAMRAVDSAGAHAGVRNAGLIGAARVRVYGAQGRWDRADSLLAALARARPGDTSVARAILELADRNRARGEAAPERARYLTLLRRFPEAPATATARFRLGLLAYVDGSRDSALALVRSALRRDTARALGLGPRYWQARLRLEAGDTTARAELRRLAADFPLTYSGVRARQLLGDTAFVSDTLLALPRPGSFPPARARDRVRTLAQLGLEAEARAEALGWTSDSSASVYVLMAAAQGAAEAGYARESIALGEAVRQRVGMVPGAARALFPIPYRAVIEGEAAELCVDPLLLAALIRQESRFDPRAISRAGALGIAQVLPSTGRQLAERLRLGAWDRDLLFVPDFNLHLGGRYVADREQRDSFPTYALLAAYNAGAGRVSRWKSWPEYTDPDLFVDRVSILETRDYVRNVYASYVWYQVAWKEPPSARFEPPVSQGP